MKYEKEFKDFLNYDRKQDYYYSIEYINVVNGNKDKNYYEIFINHLKENEIECYEDLLMERFMDYLNMNNIEYNFEEMYYDTCEYIEVCDTSEYIGNRDKYINKISYLQDLLRVVRDYNNDFFSITEYDSVYGDILEYQDNNFEDWKEKDFKEFIEYLKDLIIKDIEIEVKDNE